MTTQPTGAPFRELTFSVVYLLFKISVNCSSGTSEDEHYSAKLIYFINYFIIISNTFKLLYFTSFLLPQLCNIHVSHFLLICFLILVK